MDSAAISAASVDSTKLRASVDHIPQRLECSNRVRASLHELAATIERWHVQEDNRSLRRALYNALRAMDEIDA